MITIAEVLNNRVIASKENKLEEQIKIDWKEYHKRWCKGVQYFTDRLNEERVKNNLQPYPFMAIYKKVEHIKNIDDLLWFYKQCQAYKLKKKGNSFGKCFFGSLKLRE